MIDEDGGPAFPEADYGVPSNLRDEAILELKAKRGMSLRDYFAAKAMGAIVSASMTKEVATVLYEQGVGDYAKQFAFNAYEIADAMIAEREK